VSTAKIAHLQLNSARVPQGGTRSVAVQVTQAASLAVVSYTGGAIGATPVTIEVLGNLGAERITFASASLADIAAAVNQSAALTGVSATVDGSVVRLTSTEYGSAQFVKVRVLDSGTFTVAGSGEDWGRDVVVNVNGQTLTGTGLQVSARSTALDADITLKDTFGSVTTGGTALFGITGGGAKFSISPKLDLNSMATLGINTLTTASLGDGNVGWLYSIGTGQENAMSEKNYFTAQRIVRRALSQVATLRGRLGSFERNTLDTTANSLNIQFENLSSAESALRDTDFAEETSNLTRAQILVQSATSVLKLANQAPQNVLALLQ